MRNTINNLFAPKLTRITNIHNNVIICSYFVLWNTEIVHNLGCNLCVLSVSHRNIYIYIYQKPKFKKNHLIIYEIGRQLFNHTHTHTHTATHYQSNSRLTWKNLYNTAVRTLCWNLHFRVGLPMLQVWSAHRLNKHSLIHLYY